MRFARTLHAWAVKLFDEGVLRLVFEHARNVAIASVITAAGLQFVRHGATAVFTPPGFAGYVAAAIGITLLVLNFIDGLWRLARLRSHLAWQIALTAAYVFLAWRLAQLVLLFKTSGGGMPF